MDFVESVNEVMDIDSDLTTITQYFKEILEVPGDVDSETEFTGGQRMISMRHV